jgi:chemotaxis protein CheY-P-specific phosphatase CheC
MLEGESEGLLGLTQEGQQASTQNRPKAVLFGDSMSEYVGYNADGTPNTKYGNSIADVIGNNLGISVTNLATGGETSNEALAGGSKFGAFADYIAQNRPEYAIIRYGAADAIKNKDPKITLQSVQRMVDIARANGVTPIIVGVSELYGAQNSKTGNIAGYIDSGAEQRANAINAGLAQLAANNGLAFTDVRSAVSAGQGDLLDGVHTNADFGKKMADAISESIVEQGAIQGVNVPQLPPNVDSLSNEEKGRLYNQFIEQGFSDAQIRTAAKAESDQDWNALKQIAASVKNTTPATIERRAALEVAPPAPEVAPPAPKVEQPPAPKVEQRFEQDEEVMSQPQPVKQEAALEAAPAREQAATGVSQSIADRLMAMPRNEFETVGFQEGGKDYSMDPNGLISVRDVGAKPTDQVRVFDQSGNFLASHAVEQRSDFVQAINQAARVGIPAVIGAAILGPAGTGLLNAPAAAAVGSGGSTLLQGGSVEDALKAAALASLGAYGTQQVTGLLNNAAYDLSFAAADAAQLANQGLNAGAIAQNLATYVDPATAISLANTAATQAFALADATQLTQQGLNPNQVAQVLESSGINANTAANIAQAAADGVTTLSASDIIPEVQFQRQTNLNQGLLSPADAERVMVTGQAFDIPGIQQLAQGVGAGVSAATVPTAPQVVTQPQGGKQVQQAQIEAPRIDPDAASSILSSVLGQPVAVAGSIQQVQVTGETPRQISQNEAAAALSSLTGQQVQVTGQTVTNQQVADTLPAAAAALPQTVPVTAQTLPTTQPETVAPAATAGLLTTAPTQQVQVTSPQIDPDAASNILSSVLGQPISVAGSTQQVTVTGETPRQISPDTAAAVLSSLVGQQVQVTGQTVTSQQAAETLPAAASTILQSVPVTGQTLQTPSLQEVAPAATAGLLAPTQTVPVTAQNIPTTAADVAPAAVAGLLIPAVQNVPVTGQNLPATQGAAGPTGAMLGTTIAPTQTVAVETRTIPTQTVAPIIPVTPTQSVSVAGNREVPTATAVIPTTAAGVTAPAQPTTITARDAALAGLLLAGAGSLSGNGQSGETVSGQISGVIPTYPGRGNYQMPAMFQIAPTNVYNPFATVAPFGAGRFGAINQPFTLPRGLI